MDPSALVLLSVPLLALSVQPSRPWAIQRGHAASLEAILCLSTEDRVCFLLFVLFHRDKVFFFLKSSSLPFSRVWPVGILAYSGH